MFDTVGGERLARSSAVIRPGGRLVSVAEEPPAIDAEREIEATYFVVEPNRNQLVELGAMIDAGDLRPEIDSVYPLTDAQAAFERSMAPGKRGKVVLRVLGGVAMPSQQEKAEAFRALHAGDAFVMPNPWDAGSARVLAALGFPALATTSSGFAFTLGRLDGHVTLDEVLEHTAAVDRATDLPVSVDLENGYGPDPEQAALAIARVAGAGAVGGSIEDYDPDGRLYDRAHAVERIAAAAEAARALPYPFTLTARAENHIRGNPDLDDTIGRLQAYEAAGADVLYAPGLASPQEIRAVCEALTKPVNVLALPGLTLTEIVAAGAQRISVGGGLAWVAIDAMAAAAAAILEAGDLSALAADEPSIGGSRVGDNLSAGAGDRRHRVRRDHRLVARMVRAGRGDR